MGSFFKFDHAYPNIFEFFETGFFETRLRGNFTYLKKIFEGFFAIFLE